ncbi:MAG: hypothetical protein ACOY93_11540 [Bacillota bacterium]
MRRARPLLFLLLALAVGGCAAREPAVSDPVPPPPLPAPEAPVQPASPEPPPAPAGPRVLQEGTALRLAGLQHPTHVDWAPSGQTALISASPVPYRLDLARQELHPLPDLGTVQQLGWAGPDELLLVRWNGQAAPVGTLSLRSGAWRPLATVPGQVQICQSGSHWVWVQVSTVRQGGAGYREIGAVYRTPVPEPDPAGEPKPLGGALALERGALLGRLADGSCLLDGVDQRLLLLRPSGELQPIAEGFALPRVTRDGRGVVWLEEAGDCPGCIELGPGVPFRRLVWWRLDGKRLEADLGRPQVIDFLLAPDGERLMIGHRNFEGESGAISTLGPEGFQPGEVRSPALVPAGWMGADLLAQAAGPEGWRFRSPLLRASDGRQVAERLNSSADGGLLIELESEVRYLTPEGAVHRLSHPEPFRRDGQGIQVLGLHHPQVPYLAVLEEEAVLLVRLE